MKRVIIKNKKDLGFKAAKYGAGLIRSAIKRNGCAYMIVATGASQFELFDILTKESDIAWNKVTVFHLDEYIGIHVNHPASFRFYLWNRFHRRLPLPLAAFHYIDGEFKPLTECRRLSKIIGKCSIDVAFVGIGENGHLAFNDPPADFKTKQPYLIVKLDEACRRQQMNEGWFKRLKDVPRQAISMSIQQIMKSKTIICCAPDFRKALAVKNSLEGPITPRVPASILQKHKNVTIYLDALSSSLLQK